jgi:Zn-dependent M16 (insulinase) family peptidase
MNYLDDFKEIRKEQIKELKATLVELEHKPSGAIILSIQNDDPENVFSLSFKTHPENSNGVAHILEHTVLCGSKKFPVKDPFFSMHKRSLNTYMNALTGADFTCYPAAAYLEKDFYNILEVYLDAVFNPLLDNLSFLQEGHRLEFENPEDESTALNFRGIVYNEMKGSLASNDTRLWKQMMQALFPTLPYGFNAGGDPNEIPQLTYEELLAFHKKYYHPSHCLFFFYGNLPLEKHLEFIKEKVLKHIGKGPSLLEIGKEIRFKTPKKIKAFYPSNASEKEDESVDNKDNQTDSKIEKNIHAIGWLTCDIKDQNKWLALQLLDLIFMATDASPLKEALLRSNLCKQADLYIDIDSSEIPVVLICKGSNEENSDKIDALVQQVLKKIIQEGISKELIDGALHQMEFSRSEITGTHMPFGLSLFMRSALLKQHGVNPSEGLKIHALFDNLRQKCENPTYLAELINEFFINNPHKVILTMKPDEHLAQKEHSDEKNTLEKIKASLTEKDIFLIKEKSRQLIELQEKHESVNLEVLPKISSKDVSTSARKILLEEDLLNNLSIYRHNCFTNRIIYADLHFTLPQIDLKDLPYLRLFSGFLTEVGTSTRDYKKNLEFMQQHTGGLNAFVSLHVQSDDFNLFNPTFGLRGRALFRKSDKLFSILKDTLTSACFKDKERIKELLDQHHSNLEHHITQNALKYAINLSSKSFSLPSFIGNCVYGLDYLISLRKIIKDFDKNPYHLIEKMNYFQDILLATQNAKLVLGVDDEEYEKIKKENFYGLSQICSKPQKSLFNPQQVSVEKKNEGRIVASPVAFSALSLPSISFQHKDAAYLNIASHLFENKVLHKRIREQGGAYGAGASVHSLAGHFTFYSYRDPHLSNTYKAFLESISTIGEGKFNEQEIEEAKLQILQDLDAPIPPGQRASTAFSWLLAKKDQQVRDTYRKNLLNAGKDQIIEATKLHIKNHLNEATLVSFAGKDLLENESKLLKSMGVKDFLISNV